SIVNRHSDTRYIHSFPTRRSSDLADSAEPDTIDRLKKGWKPDELPRDLFNTYPRLAKGFFIEKAIKGPGSIKAGISLMTGMNLLDRKSTRLNSSHVKISYAVFCLK